MQVFVVYGTDRVSNEVYWVSAIDEYAARRAVATSTPAKDATSRTRYACLADDTEKPTPGYVFCRGASSRIEVAIAS